MPFSIPQLRSIHCGRQQGEPRPRLGYLSQLMGIQFGGGCHGLPQHHLCADHIAALDNYVSFPQDKGMILCTKLCRAPDIYNQVSFNDAGGRQVLQGQNNWVGDR